MGLATPVQRPGYDYPDGTTSVASPINIARGGPVPTVYGVDLPAGGHAIGQSWKARLLGTAALTPATIATTNAVVQTQDYGTEAAFYALIDRLKIDGGPSNGGGTYIWNVNWFKAGTVAASSTTTVVKTSGMGAMSANQYQNLVMEFRSDTITAGLRGVTRTIASNTAHASAGELTVTPEFLAPPAPAVGVPIPVAGDKFVIYQPTRVDGARIDGCQNTVSRCLINYCSGAGIRVRNTNGGGLVTPMQWVLDNTIIACFEGIVIESGADNFVRGNMVHGVRGHCCDLRVGATKVTDNHFYGAGDGQPGTNKAALFTTHQTFIDATDMSDSDYGLVNHGNGTTVNGCRIQSNWTHNVSCHNTTAIIGCPIQVNQRRETAPSSGVYIGSTGVHIPDYAINCSVRGGEIELVNHDAIGVNVFGRGTHLDTRFLVTNPGGATPPWANVTGVRVDATTIRGRRWNMDVKGFTGTGSAALRILNWGDNNAVFITTDPNTAGEIPVAIAADKWGTGNEIWVDGERLIPDRAYP